jgi:hypothetical protein
VKKTKERGAIATVLFTVYYLGDQIGKNDMDVSCSTHEGKEEVHKGFRLADLMKETT